MKYLMTIRSVLGWDDLNECVSSERSFPMNSVSSLISLTVIVVVGSITKLLWWRSIPLVTQRFKLKKTCDLIIIMSHSLPNSGNSSCWYPHQITSPQEYLFPCNSIQSNLKMYRCSNKQLMHLQLHTCLYESTYNSIFDS